MRDAILAALREHGSLSIDEVVHTLRVDHGKALKTITGLPDDFEIYPELFGPMNGKTKYRIVEV